MSPTEAAERWGIKKNSLIAALNRGKFDEQIEKGLIRKYVPEHGKTEWYITEQAMIEVYGEPKEEKKMVKVFYEDIFVGEVITNRSLTVDEALELIGFDEETFLEENSFDAIDYNDFKLVY